MKQVLLTYLLTKGISSSAFLILVFAPIFYSGIFIENQINLLSIIILTPPVVYQLILKKSIHLSLIDIILLVFSAFYIVRLFTSQGGYEWHLLKLLSLTCWYILFRLHSSFWIITYLLVIFGVIQTILVILQSQFIIYGYHQFFNTTGTFHNPTLLGGFLAISFIMALSVGKNYLQQKNKKGYIFIACSMFMVWGLYLSDSRAAWLAVFSCILLTLLKNRCRRWTRKKELLLILGCGIIVILLSIILYQYKPVSANGRLFIWERSLEMIRDKPLWGHGINGFRGNYMHYQADYFEKNPQSNNSMLADNVEYVYNELIKISVEMGIVGLILFLILLFSLLKKYDNIIIYNGLIVLIVFSLFSYPSDVYIFLLIFCFFAANLPHKTLFLFDISHQLLIGILWIAPTFMSLGLCKMYYYYLIDTCVKKCNNFNEFFCQDDILKQYHKLKYHPQFMMWFAKQMFQSKDWNNALPVLKDALLIYPCLEIYCDLGTIYQQQNKYQEAKIHYTIALNMIPSRITPKYKLFKLYLHEKDSLNAKKVANQILNSPIKIENTSFLKMKAKIMNSGMINN